jgi:hypothetical protein
MSLASMRVSSQVGLPHLFHTAVHLLCGSSWEYIFVFEQVICLTWVESNAPKCSFLCPCLEKLTLKIHQVAFR